MHITRTILLLVIAQLAIPLQSRYISRQQHQLKEYEIRRPLQYFFYLLELKSTLNPMLGSLIRMGDHCSSKAGPFCTFVGHQTFQTHSVRLSELNEQQKNVYAGVMAQQKYNFELYDSLILNQDDRFLIRNDLTNEFDRILRQKIGDRMHMANMLPHQYFQEVK